ncbi:hypothetical protein K2173_002507 [Erythroxylum novogranatense]|uniref:Uncharacterized protein n=1 Tax=Erythroxylum novogranatense TaxID=1862640 RepID=A0AAV8TRF8_9ROSI|nr:hypothetical protein K2173_002507 [Erythroxylum novogranatense]
MSWQNPEKPVAIKPKLTNTLLWARWSLNLELYFSQSLSLSLYCDFAFCILLVASLKVLIDLLFFLRSELTSIFHSGGCFVNF